MNNSNTLRAVGIPLILAGLALIGFVMLGSVADASPKEPEDQSDSSSTSQTTSELGIKIRKLLSDAKGKNTNERALLLGEIQALVDEDAKAAAPSIPWPKEKLTFEFPADKGGEHPTSFAVHTNVGFTSVTQAETINGTVSNDSDYVEGNLEFDGAKLTGMGKIIVWIPGMRTGNATRDEHLLGWMGVEEGNRESKQIVFDTKKITHLSGDLYEVEGKMTIRGETSDHKLTMEISFLPAKTVKILNWDQEGDGSPWVQIRGELKVDRLKHGLKSPSENPQAENKVAKVWDITIDLKGRLAPSK